MKIKYLLFFLLLSLVYCFNTKAKTADTLYVYFDINVHVLSSSENEKLLQFISSLSIDKIISININAYADSTGNTQSNELLANKRLETINTFLHQNIKNNTIKYSTKSTGETIKFGADLSKNRCVEIVILYANETNPKEKNINDISSYKKGDKIVLENILFENNSHILLTSSLHTLKQLADILFANPSVSIMIIGHVCCGGNDKNYDMYDPTDPTLKVSATRAKAVYDYLVNNGIMKSRLKYKGMSFKEPLVFPEKTEADRQKNRRVEIEIL